MEGSWVDGGGTELLEVFEDVASLSKSWDSFKTKCLERSDAAVKAARLK